MSLPRITVVIPTRGRREWASRAARAVLANDYPNFRVVLVDQTADPLPTGLLPTDERFRYLQSPTAGISAARNAGVANCPDAIVAHTDDDCEAPIDWLSGIASAFARHPEVDLMFGEVDAGPTRNGGFIPSYHVREETTANRLESKHRIEGIGACMAYRLSLWESLEGFDEALGAGGELHSAEEVDFTNRALAAGQTVMVTKAFRVIHHGFRTWESQDDLLSGHLFGIGASAAKQVKQGSLQFCIVLARLAFRWAFGTPVVDFGRPPARLPRLRAFLRGFSAGWARPLDGRAHFETGAVSRPAAQVRIVTKDSN